MFAFRMTQNSEQFSSCLCYADTALKEEDCTGDNGVTQEGSYMTDYMHLGVMNFCAPPAPPTPAPTLPPQCVEPMRLGYGVCSASPTLDLGPAPQDAGYRCGDLILTR